MKNSALNGKSVKFLAQVPEDVLPLVPGFLMRREVELVEIKSHLQSEDYDFIRMIGHRLRGSGAGYGLVEFTNFGKALEEAAIIHDHQQLAITIKELQDFVFLVKNELAE